MKRVSFVLGMSSRKLIEIASLDIAQRIHELSSQIKPSFQRATVKHFSLVVEQEDPGLIPALLKCFYLLGIWRPDTLLRDLRIDML